MLALFYMTYIGIRCRMQPHMGPPTPEEIKFTRAEKLGSLVSIWPFMLLIIIVLGAIWGGIATPSEAAAFGATGAFVINLIYGKLTWPVLKESLEATVKLSGMGLWILIASNIYLNVFNSLGSQQLVTDLVLSMPGGTTGVLLMMMFIILLLGMVMDDWAIIMLCTPLFIPIIDTLGIDKLWFGVLFIVNIQIAYLTPPFGFVLFWFKKCIAPRCQYGGCLQVGVAIYCFTGSWIVVDFLFPSNCYVAS